MKMSNRIIETRFIKYSYHASCYNKIWTRKYLITCMFPNEVWETYCFCPSPNVNIVFTLFLLLLLRYFLFVNVLRNYSRYQHETFQDDSLAFIDVSNVSDLFSENAFTCVHVRLNFCTQKRAKLTFLFFVQIQLNLYGRQILRFSLDLLGQNNRPARASTCARANVLNFGYILLYYNFIILHWFMSQVEIGILN
jgi:hypothetical protein